VTLPENILSAVARSLRARAGVALPLTWLFNVSGPLDLYQGLRHDVQLGAAHLPAPSRI